MLSFESVESNLFDRELTLGMQAPTVKYIKGDDSQRSEDVKKCPRVVEQVLTGDESESDEEQELIRRLNILNGTG